MIEFKYIQESLNASAFGMPVERVPPANHG
jgi:hypothetical protein